MQMLSKYLTIGKYGKQCFCIPKTKLSKGHALGKSEQ